MDKVDQNANKKDNVQWASQNNGLKSNLKKSTYLHCLLLSAIESRSEIQKHAGPGKRKNQQAFFPLIALF